MIKWKEGFTLIEIIIGTAIMAIVFTSGIAAFRRFDDRQQIVNAGRELIVTIRDVQKRAQSGEKPKECNSLDGWALRKDTGQDEYRIAAICSGLEANSSIQTKALLGNVEFIQSSFNFVFNVISGEVTNPGTLSVSNADGTLIYEIEISGAGGVNDLGIRD